MIKGFQKTGGLWRVFDRHSLFCNPPDVKTDAFLVELTGLSWPILNQIIRVILIASDGSWHSLKPVIQGSRAGARGAYSGSLYGLNAVLAVQLEDGICGVWTLPDPSASFPLGDPQLFRYTGELPEMCPDYSRGTYVTRGEQIIGYGVSEQWRWVADVNGLAQMLASRRMTATDVVLCGSTRLPTLNGPDDGENGYYFYHLDELREPLRHYVGAMRRRGILTRIQAHCGNYTNRSAKPPANPQIPTDSICNPVFSDAWFASVVEWLEETLGPSGILLQPVGEPFHGTCRGCVEKLRSWHRLLDEPVGRHGIPEQRWSGQKAWNWPETPTIDWKHEIHPGDENDFAYQGCLLYTDAPRVIDYLVGPNGQGIPGKVEDYSRRCRRAGVGMIYYEYPWDAWARPDADCVGALERGWYG